MNKKGFTLVELLAVISIIAILSLIAIPNMVGISDDVRKETMLDDAKKMISLAKMKVSIDYEIRNSSQATLYLKDIDTNGDVKVDPDGGTYNRDNSFVKYSKSGGLATYCVFLDGSKRRIGTSSSCIRETDLYSKSNVITK